MKLKQLLPLLFSSVYLLSVSVAQAATAAVSTPAADLQPQLCEQLDQFIRQQLR